MGRIRRALLVVVVVVLFLLLIIPARADSESWTLWSSTDCNAWSGGCDGDFIYTDGEWTSTTMSNSYCTDASVRVHGYIDGDLSIQIAGVSISLSDPGGLLVYFEQRLMSIPENGTVSLRVTNEGFIDGVVVECYDPYPMVSTPSTPVPASLEAMTDAGEDILRSSAATLIPMIIGLTIGLGIVVMILRYMRWL